MFGTLQFSSLGDFIDMGGYAFNVWSVYVLFATFFFINLYFPLLKKKQIIREQKRRLVVNQETHSRNSESGVMSNNPSSTGDNT